jgi:hypothetical protein
MVSEALQTLSGERPKDWRSMDDLEARAPSEAEKPRFARAKPFVMPHSPFEAEKLALGWGFMAPPTHPRARSCYRYRPARSPTNPNYPRLTDAEREFIGSTGPETPIRVLMQRFGVGERYVKELRAQYRRRSEGAD